MYRASAELTVSFDTIDWPFLKQIYGWASFQWQAWARGELYVLADEPQTLVLYTDNVVEFWIDDEHHYGGDFYAFRRAPVTLKLTPGPHRVAVRLFRDVRGMGGFVDPDVSVRMEVVAHQPQAPWLKIASKVLISDLIGNDDVSLASPFASVVLRNDADKDIQVVGADGNGGTCHVRMSSTEQPMVLRPGQSRPIALTVAYNGKAADLKTAILAFRYLLDGVVEPQSLMTFFDLQVRDIHDPHKMTFMHPGGMVSYAVLRPPSRKAVEQCSANATLPVLLQLHGAGLEAEDDLVRYALDALPDLGAWVLFPTGVTPWSGDDWHTWGFADVEAAISSIPAWLQNTAWEGPGVDIDRWLVGGHSNGGQGTWYALTHRPDKVIAAAPLSGYSSIQNYVPYTHWLPADPSRTAIVQAALNSYRHELLLENAKGIPVYQQHGDADDNVPAYHSRLLAQRIQQAGGDSEYVEYQNQPHFWDGVATTAPLRRFWEVQLKKFAHKDELQAIDKFSLVVANPGDMGPKNGLYVCALIQPGQLGRVDVSVDADTSACVLATSNTRRFWLSSSTLPCGSLIVDGQRIDLRDLGNDNNALLKTKTGWILSTEHTALGSPTKRTPRQMGGLEALLRTHGKLLIARHTEGEISRKIALQISRNLCQYFAADTMIVSGYAELENETGNMISIAVGEDLPPVEHVPYPISVKGGRLVVEDDLTDTMQSSSAADDQFGVFLRPWESSRVELVVWAARAENLDIAARLVPMMTGAGLPDFVIGDRSMMWKGLEGVLALGWLDDSWRVSRNSFFV